MKKKVLGLVAVLLLATMVSAIACGGRTVEASGLAGSWWPARDLDNTVTEIDAMRSTEIALELNSENQALITRRYSDGDVEKAESTSFRQVGSLFYWKFERDDGVEYQLVLGGWKLESGTSMLFGHLYLANSDHGLFNGWPVTLRRDSS